jgi:hypothetical protein
MFPINPKDIPNLALAIVVAGAITVAAQEGLKFCSGHKPAEALAGQKEVDFGALLYSDGRWWKEGSVGHEQYSLDSPDILR